MRGVETNSMQKTTSQMRRYVSRISILMQNGASG